MDTNLQKITQKMIIKIFKNRMIHNMKIMIQVKDKKIIKFINKSKKILYKPNKILRNK